MWIVTSAALMPALRSHLAGKRVRWILEPAPRNTAAALALAAEVIRRRVGPCWLLCLPADQWVQQVPAFCTLVRRIISQEPFDWLITFGIPPASSNPGYGYIAPGTPLSEVLRVVRRFVEKPVAAVAKRYVASGTWLWNSGMFLWHTNRFLQEVRRLQPEITRAAERVAAGLPRPTRPTLRLWRSLRPVSVDTGVMERAAAVAVARAHIGWTDLGSWEALARTFRESPDHSRSLGRYLSVGGGHCFIYAPGRLTVNVGARGIGAVITEDAVLLFDRPQHERVREVPQRLARIPALRKYW